MGFGFPAGGGDQGEGGTLLPQAAPEPPGDPQRIAIAKWLLRTRKTRPDISPSSLYGEPAWDMLLDLYIRQKQGLRTSVSSACHSANAPHTTSLRFIGLLFEAGWVDRRPDVRDKRRRWLALHTMAVEQLEAYLDSLILDQMNFGANVGGTRAEPDDRDNSEWGAGVAIARGK